MKKSPDWMKVRAEAELFLAYSKKYLPEYVTEIKGTADAVGLELEDLFGDHQPDDTDDAPGRGESL